MAAAQLRAPLFEDKVVDLLFSKAEISERSVTRAELEHEIEAEEGHVHGPDCGHDHAPAPKAKKGKKATAEEAPAAEPKKAKGKAKAAEAPAAKKEAPAAEAKPAKKPAAKKAPADKAPAEKPAKKAPAKSAKKA
jgi:trigger factor